MNAPGNSHARDAPNIPALTMVIGQNQITRQCRYERRTRQKRNEEL